MRRYFADTTSHVPPKLLTLWPDALPAFVSPTNVYSG
jgi:hypothetical protein